MLKTPSINDHTSAQPAPSQPTWLEIQRGSTAAAASTAAVHISEDLGTIEVDTFSASHLWDMACQMCKSSVERFPLSSNLFKDHAPQVVAICMKSFEDVGVEHSASSGYAEIGSDKLLW